MWVFILNEFKVLLKIYNEILGKLKDFFNLEAEIEII